MTMSPLMMVKEDILADSPLSNYPLVSHTRPGTPAACNTSWMPVWWYPCSSIRWSPASTRVALVGALGLGRASALAYSAMCDLLRRKNRPVDYYCQVVESKYSKCDRPTVSLDVISLVAGPNLAKPKNLAT